MHIQIPKLCGYIRWYLTMCTRVNTHGFLHQSMTDSFGQKILCRTACAVQEDAERYPWLCPPEASSTSPSCHNQKCEKTLLLFPVGGGAKLPAVTNGTWMLWSCVSEWLRAQAQESEHHHHHGSQPLSCHASRFFASRDNHTHCGAVRMRQEDGCTCSGPSRVLLEGQLLILLGLFADGPKNGQLH